LSKNDNFVKKFGLLGIECYIVASLSLCCSSEACSKLIEIKIKDRRMPMTQLKAKKRLASVWLLLAIVCAIVFATPAQAGESIGSSLAVEGKTQAQSRKTQQRVDQLASETQRLLAEYQRISQQLDYQQSYAAEIEQKLLEQDDEIARLEQAIADIQITRLHLLPLLREMLDTLRAFIELDLPFEQQQRLAAADKLGELLSSSEVSIADKFRRVMELYQTENDYSYSLGTYREQISIEGKSYTVDILRVGRLALYYRSLDGEHVAMWSQDANAWQSVSEISAAARQINTAIRVAKEQQAPELLQLPYLAGAWLVNEHSTDNGAAAAKSAKEAAQ
jgi:vacuolar-type H+-ATPase subunit I/STV1